MVGEVGIEPTQSLVPKTSAFPLGYSPYMMDVVHRPSASLIYSLDLQLPLATGFEPAPPGFEGPACCHYTTLGAVVGSQGIEPCNPRFRSAASTLLVTPAVLQV